MRECSLLVQLGFLDLAWRQVAFCQLGMEVFQIDTGDHVIIVNAAKIRLTGGKEAQKVYRRHTGYPGGLVETGARRMRETKPERMIELAVSGMLPKTKLGKQMYRKLKVYAGEQHPHEAQKPAAMAVA